jgi:hypothetical protein
VDDLRKPPGVFAQADKNTYGIADILVVVPEKPPGRQRQTIGIAWRYINN